MNKRLTIAIDGPAGAGKSTAARLLAQRFGYLYIDTGAMYRALTEKALRLGVDPDDREGIVSLAGRTEIKLIQRNGMSQQVICDGRDVSAAIRRPEVSERVSRVARIPEVRQRMVLLQRQMAAGGGVVMDGRDIGTVVLPDADRKFFLTASLEERAHRRLGELAGQGFDADLRTVMTELAARDQIDSQREVAPLSCAPDAIIIDTTGMSIESVVDLLADYCRKETQPEGERV